MYKNKLTNIRACQKDYYTIQIENNKNNIKGIWNVLYSIIQKISSNAINAEYFVDEVININNMEDVVNGFNNYFVNIGPKLAEKNQKQTQRQKERKMTMGMEIQIQIFLVQ